jgi:hypothetical protein
LTQATRYQHAGAVRTVRRICTVCAPGRVDRDDGFWHEQGGMFVAERQECATHRNAAGTSDAAVDPGRGKDETVTLLDGADWGSKVFSSGWTTAQGGTL